MKFKLNEIVPEKEWFTRLDTLMQLEPFIPHYVTSDKQIFVIDFESLMDIEPGTFIKLFQRCTRNFKKVFPNATLIQEI
jgi:hypothetical protein